MKKIKYLILITLCLLLVGCGKSEDEDTKKAAKKATSSPLLIEVAKDGSANKLYLFGSIHAADNNLYPFPDYVLNAYQKSDALAVEFDLIEYSKDMSKQVEDLALMAYADGTNIIEHLPEDLYEESKSLLEEGNTYVALYDYYKPIMWVSLVDNIAMEDAGLDADKGVDNYFLKKAKEDKKAIIELESSEFQYNLLAGFSDEMQELLLASSVFEYDESVESLKELYKLYQKGDKKALETLLATEDDIDEEYSENAEKLAEEYNDALITKRNKAMMSKLKEYFNEGQNVFCVVGLAHIVSEGGIADLMEKEGYTIKIINQ